MEGSGMTKTVAIDFDGVIHRYSKGWQDGTIYDLPVDGALEALAKLRTQCSVVIFTSRSTHQVFNWLKEYGVKRITAPVGKWPNHPFWNDQEYILVTNEKPSASVYIDDRGIRFEDWDQTLADLAALERIHIT